MTPLTSQLTAYFNIIPISPGEDVPSVHGLVNFKMMLNGQVTGRGMVGFCLSTPGLDAVPTFSLDATVWPLPENAGSLTAQV